MVSGESRALVKCTDKEEQPSDGGWTAEISPCIRPELVEPPQIVFTKY